MENANKREFLDETLKKIYTQLENLEAVPGIQIQTGSTLKTPPFYQPPEVDEDSPTYREEITKPDHPQDY